MPIERVIGPSRESFKSMVYFIAPGSVEISSSSNISRQRAADVLLKLHTYLTLQPVAFGVMQASTGDSSSPILKRPVVALISTSLLSSGHT